MAAKRQPGLMKVRHSGTEWKFSKLKFRPRDANKKCVGKSCFSANRRSFSILAAKFSSYSGCVFLFRSIHIPHVSFCVHLSENRCVYNPNICKTIVVCRSLTGDSQTMFQIIFLFLICTNGNCVDAKVQTKQKPIWVVYSEASVRDTRVFTCQKENGSEKTQKQSKDKCQGGIQTNSIF